MPASRRSSGRSSPVNTGPMIAIILAGVLVFVLVTLGDLGTDMPVGVNGATMEAPATGERWSQVEPAIAQYETHAVGDA